MDYGEGFDQVRGQWIVSYDGKEYLESVLKLKRDKSRILDIGKLCLIDNLVQQRCNLVEAEFAVIRSEIRDSLANRCRYLRRMLAPRDVSII